jgi:hypothetical protein
MDELTRRNALHLAAGLGLAAAFGGAPAEAADDMTKEQEKADRERVLACGLTADEADCWEWTAKAAGKFFDLPKLHPMDAQEVASAIHIIQHKLLSRPVYRRYLELAKAQKK